MNDPKSLAEARNIIASLEARLAARPSTTVTLTPNASVTTPTATKPLFAPKARSEAAGATVVSESSVTHAPVKPASQAAQRVVPALKAQADAQADLQETRRLMKTERDPRALGRMAAQARKLAAIAEGR